MRRHFDFGGLREHVPRQPVAIAFIVTGLLALKLIVVVPRLDFRSASRSASPAKGRCAASIEPAARFHIAALRKNMMRAGRSTGLT